MNKYLSSALGGTLATGPMTLLMTYLHERLPEEKRKFLEPRETIMNMARMTGVKPSNEKIIFPVSLALHFGYGTFVGSFFSLWPRKKGKIFQGMGHGLIVWAVSYNVLLPALRLYKPSFRQSWDQNTLLISTHVLWGTALALFEDLLEREHKLSGFVDSKALKTNNTLHASKEALLSVSSKRI